MNSQQSTTIDSLQERLQCLRNEMIRMQLDAVLVCSTDMYLSEYVPIKQSVRAFLTGFTGSVGDAVITQDSATLFVDGRYRLQAKQQAPYFDVQVVALGQSIEQAWLQHLNTFKTHKSQRLFVSQYCLSMQLFAQLAKVAEKTQNHPIQIVTEQQHPPVWHTLWQNLEEPSQPLRHVAQTITGCSVAERLAALRPFLQQHQLQGFFVGSLDAIAWLTNLRGSDFASQSVFAAQAVLLHDRVLLATSHGRQIPSQLEPCVHVTSQLHNALKKHLGNRFRVGVDPRSTTQAAATMLQEAGAHIVKLPSPIDPAKARKTPQELLHMRSCFARADRCVHAVQQWLCREVTKGKQITEHNVGERIRQEFNASGACDVSFAPICAAGAHGAIVHYTQLDNQQAIQPGQLFLMDVGALYEGGYATDLTRTFLVGDESVQATQEQKNLFTAVLQAAIAGMHARIPKGTSGSQLDALVRGQLWQHGLNYAHGTGHGVGIHVHESPPRLSPGGHEPLQVGHLFSVEPGVYLPKWGGIRIENVCTLVDDPEHADYTCVLPLSFAPLDERLIELGQLSQVQRRFLRYFASCFALADNELPPVASRMQVQQ